ncbi:MAG: hypothetical protein JNL54_22405 [Kineosporiaceae bacterium]|nr:hypothetical protein [Kineosporiaceae bacterium]
MNPITAGVGLAALVAGPPLYAMVQRGELDLTGALERGGLVAVACAVGARWISTIADGYARDHRRARVEAQRDALLAEQVTKLLSQGNAEGGGPAGKSAKPDKPGRVPGAGGQ